MKKEFQALKDLLFDSNTYDNEGMDNWSDVHGLLTELGAKIDEVEKRMDCAIRSSKEIIKAIAPYQDAVDNNSPFTMSVAHWDTINNGANDVEITLDLDDDMCVVDNWYGLFQPKKEVEPIAVGNVEYDFPEEVYTIGNIDNTEIIGDVYESVFVKLVEAKVVINEMDKGFPKGGNVANWVISHNQFIPLIKFHQIDLSKVPIKREVFLTLESSWGYITCDRDGMVIDVDGDLEFNGEKNYLYDIVKFDLDEYEKFLNELGWELEASHIDILSVGFWDNEGKYQEAEPTHRNYYIVNPNKVADMVEEEVDEETHPIVGCGMCGHPQVVLEENIEVGENGHQVVRCDECQGATDIDAPTMLCADPKKHEIVNNIISQLNAIEVDGETMEYILKQVGMDQQMLKQLFAQTMNDEVDYLLDVRNGKA